MAKLQIKSVIKDGSQSANLGTGAILDSYSFSILLSSVYKVDNQSKKKLFPFMFYSFDLLFHFFNTIL
jgi:hypothetical protein